MADDDNFDIDIYGEDLDDPSAPYKKVAAEDELFHDDDGKPDTGKSNGNAAAANGTTEDTNMEGANVTDNVKQEPIPQPPQHNSLKRKHPDNRHVDVNATTALYISELNWWTTDDDIRGWIRQADCEDELKDITFSEHKVNGKSKGVAFVEFTTTQASSATKAKIESFATQPGYQSKRHTVNFTQPHSNPFRTLPKDAPARNKDDNRSGPGNFNKDNRPHGPMSNNFPSPANFAPQSNMMGNNMGGGGGGGGGGGYRGGRGNMMGGGRGNMGGSGGGGYMNRNNAGNHMGGGGGSGSPPQSFGMMNQPGGFGNMGGGGGGGGGGMQFQGGGGGGGGGGFQGNRGGMNMGMRGGGPPNRGRGGFNNNMGMPMGGMGPNMGMNPPMGGMNMGGPMGNMGGGDMSGGNSNFNPMMGSGFNPMMGGGGKASSWTPPSSAFHFEIEPSANTLRSSSIP
ncbi:hypothetical protein TWF225_006275 [Orbilia oligospora]|uniref:RRM domain-containing protein n=1 Tax=Orbilia oligospora TaxID=2813651 RepID=A0A7C8N755_ORBOL|nr:hypothetical protein TWF103_002295 [Orbilia oligospora]KAF3103305.1 hypothetical protein TWF706_004915 [Orbilia oligospora]KAF3103985.1 hypothetical protein TWF102_003366 [Orbilia oligospora]KAF3138033.1 hypothetical protein TWF594_007290 [Orbilia oligospora]KAF3166515.1 hypothetical protein TWF751_008635 [Orbilia oligospora]